MLNQLEKLKLELDGRYASDSELQFMTDYLASYSLRASAYRKIQEAERDIISQVYAKMQAIDPTCFTVGKEDVTGKCERDTLFVLRWSALALLLNDTQVLQERVLFWLQTILRSFHDHQRRCNLTYQIMQEVVRQYLTPEEAQLFCPILELNRNFLGMP